MVISKHILGTFDEALTSLRNDLLMMAGLAERSLCLLYTSDAADE